MKLEFLSKGSPDCPLIRLYGYRADEVEHLRAACRDLADGRRKEFALHEQPWVDAIGGCKFFWEAGVEDIGVSLPSVGNPFVLSFSEEAWREVEGKLLPFAGDAAGFNWLTNEGDVEVLISPNGLW
jgi:hypothetical protein